MPSVTAMPVDPDLTRKLRSLARRIEDATDERDRLVVQAVREGGSLREVAALVGLTHAGVKDIVRRKGDG